MAILRSLLFSASLLVACISHHASCHNHPHGHHHKGGVKTPISSPEWKYAAGNPDRSYQAPATTYTYMVPNMPNPRLEWNENYGYCGSVAMITGGLKYGLYISQYDNRYIASNGTDESQESSQLLLGVNDYWAATQHKLNNYLWEGDQTSATAFMEWMKKMVVSGYVVMMGIYENSSVFGQSPDPDYDHIVPVVGWGSNHPLTDTSYYDDDVIYFTDNGLYTPDGNTPIYSFSYPLSTFMNSRSNADSSNAPVYSMNAAPTLNDPNYAIALTGIMDDDGTTMEVYMDTDKNYEEPEIVDGSNTRPSAMSLTLTVTVTGLTSGTEYNLYQYSHFQNVPTSSFNANAGQADASTTFTASGTTYTKTITGWQSDERVIFRCVPASAP